MWSVFVMSGVVDKPNLSSDDEEDEALESMRFNFNIESLGLVLYSDDPKQVSGHTESLGSWIRFSQCSERSCMCSLLMD